MKRRSRTILLTIGLSVLCGSAWATLLQEKKPRRIERVKRPTFSEKDWDGIYFKDLFAEGLVGPRPEKAASADVPSLLADDLKSNESSTLTFTWSRFISGDVIENEVKSIEQDLRKQVTTPVKFKSEYEAVRQSYSILSLMFAVIRDYDNEEVRWKRFAPIAQATFGRTAVNSRTGTPQAYENARLSRDLLTDMVRGGTFGGTDKAPEELDWSVVVDRNPLMERLQVAVDQLKPATANNGEFKKNLELIRHEANIVAAIGQVLIQDGMDEADEEEYAQYAVAMSQAAVKIVEAVKNNDHEQTSKAANLIDQACSNCHSDWR